MGNSIKCKPNDSNEERLRKRMVEVSEVPKVDESFNGKKRYMFKYGGSYIGEWKNGKMNGKGIRKLYYNDSTYEGDFVENRMEGHGLVKHKLGSTYEGNMKNNLAEGFGIYQYSNCEQRYEGEFKHDDFCGFGKYFNGDNLVYEGQFEGGVFSGFGVMNYNADFKSIEGREGKYCGGFLNGVREGRGVFYDIDGSCIYSGYFKNDRKHGRFGKSFRRGVLKFEGEFKNGNEFDGTKYSQKGNKVYVGFCGYKTVGFGVSFVDSHYDVPERGSISGYRVERAPSDLMIEKYTDSNNEIVTKISVWRIDDYIPALLAERIVNWDMRYINNTPRIDEKERLLFVNTDPSETCFEVVFSERIKISKFFLFHLI